MSFPNQGLFGVVGKSGSGKSTLLNLLSLLERPTTGVIKWNGINLSSLHKKEEDAYRNERIGFVYQRFNLLDDETVIYNVALPLLIRGEKESKANRLALDLLKSWGLGYLAKKKAGVLSGGEKQRVSLLRALTKEPEVIFADEPTGALDKASSLTVMDALKEASKKRLVIIVSHNEPLIKKYAKGIVRLEDGKVVEDTISKDEDLPLPTKSHKWKRPTYGKEIFITHLREDMKKNILSFLGSFITFSTILLSLGFILGSKGSLEIEKKKSLLLYNASLSSKKTISLPNSPLSVVKNLRPTFAEAKEFLPSSLSCHNDYSYFFPSSLTYSFLDKERPEASFAPIYDSSLKELKSHVAIRGESLNEDFSSCVVNEEFAKLYSEDVIGKSLSFARETVVKQGDKTSTVNIEGSFNIKGVVKEFSFLNAPRVYYSFFGLEEKMRDTFLTSLNKGETYNVISLLNECSGDETYGSYSLNVFAHDEKGYEDLLSYVSLAKGDGLSLSSYYSSLTSSFDSLHDALSASLLPFVILEVAGVVFIIGAIAFSSFLCRKREASILLSLGASLSSISISYILESLLVSVVAMAVSILFSPLLVIGLNAFLLSVTSIPSLVNLPLAKYLGIPLLIPALAIGFSLIIAYLGSAIPFLTIKKKHISEELNEE